MHSWSLPFPRHPVRAATRALGLLCLLSACTPSSTARPSADAAAPDGVGEPEPSDADASVDAGATVEDAPGAALDGGVLDAGAPLDAAIAQEADSGTASPGCAQETEPNQDGDGNRVVGDANSVQICGALSSDDDVDDFVFTFLGRSSTVRLSIQSTGDASARMETPDGDRVRTEASVGGDGGAGGDGGTVAEVSISRSDGGDFYVRVGSSKGQSPQTYRVTITRTP